MCVPCRREEVRRQNAGLSRTPLAASAPLPEPVPPPPPSRVPVDLYDTLFTMLRKGEATLQQMAVATNHSPGAVLDVLLELQGEGKNIHARGDRWALEKAPVIGTASGIEPYIGRTGSRFTHVFGWTGDNHAGSKYARLDALRDTYKRFADAGVDRVFHTGNWIDGEAHFNRYDLLVHGMDGQIDYLAQEYPISPLHTYAVAGNDHEGWYGAREGIDIGRHAELLMHKAGRSEWHHLGHMEAYVPLQHPTSGLTSMLHVMHPGGGSAYAVSYTVQKIVEGYEGGNKPAVGLYGHYHKLDNLNIRNVITIQTGCTQDQTPFARQKKLRFEIGAGICELEQDGPSGAIVSARIETWHYFDKGFYQNERWSHAGPVQLPARM